LKFLGRFGKWWGFAHAYSNHSMNIHHLSSFIVIHKFRVKNVLEKTFHTHLLSVCPDIYVLLLSKMHTTCHFEIICLEEITFFFFLDICEGILGVVFYFEKVECSCIILFLEMLEVLKLYVFEKYQHFFLNYRLRLF
jgi:hypothetical protein